MNLKTKTLAVAFLLAVSIGSASAYQTWNAVPEQDSVKLGEDVSIQVDNLAGADGYKVINQEGDVILEKKKPYGDLGDRFWIMLDSDKVGLGTHELKVVEIQCEMKPCSEGPHSDTVSFTVTRDGNGIKVGKPSNMLQELVDFFDSLIQF